MFNHRTKLKLESSYKIWLNNDLYLLEPLSNGFIINNNYQGISILNFDLSLVKNISFPNQLAIEAAFIKFNSSEIFLDCSEYNSLLHINLITGKVSKLPWNNYKIIFMKDIYSWKETLILSTDNDEFFRLIKHHNHIELEKIKPDELNKIDSEFLQFYDLTLKSNILKVYANKKAFIFNDFKNKRICYSMINKKKPLLIMSCIKEQIFENKEIRNTFHDAQYIDEGIFIFIGEDFIKIRKNQEEYFITPEYGYTFTQATPFKLGAINYLTVAGYNISDCKKSFLEQYQLPF